MSQIPSWLTSFVEQASDEVASMNTTDEIHCHVFHNTEGEESEWEVSLFCGANSVGGRLQAFPLDPVLSVDVFALASLLDQPQACRWQSRPIDSEDDLGAHLSLEGIHNGERIWLRILGDRPEILDHADAAVRSTHDRT